MLKCVDKIYVKQRKYLKTKKLPFGSFVLMAGATRLELATPCVTGMYSNQLNYRTNLLCHTSFSKASAKVLLFFDMTKFFEKKVQFYVIFLEKVHI